MIILGNRVHPGAWQPGDTPMRLKRAVDARRRRRTVKDLELAAWHREFLRFSGIIRGIVEKGDRVESGLHKGILILFAIFAIARVGAHTHSGMPEWLSGTVETMSILVTLILMAASVMLRIIRNIADPAIDRDRERGFPAPEHAIKLEQLFLKEGIFEDCPSDTELLPPFLSAWSVLGLEAFAFHSPLDVETRYTTYERYARNPQGITLFRSPASYTQPSNETAPGHAKTDLPDTHFGFVCTFPVAPAQFTELRQGVLSPYDLVPVIAPEENNVFGAPDQPIILYVQSVYLRARARRALTEDPQRGYQWLARAALVRSMLRVLSGCQRPLYVFALAASDKGGVMLEHLGFMRTCRASTGIASYWIYELDTRLLMPPQTPAGIKTAEVIARLRAMGAPRA